MKKYFLQITFFILAFLSIQPAFSQEREIKAADDYFGDLQYQLAIEKYTKAWDKLKKQTYEKQRVEHKLAECYRLTNKPNDAVVWYGKIADTKLAEKKPEIWLHYADALRSTGNCEKATIYYGVRISWLMLATKRLLIRLASSATSRAIRSRSACLCSVMSLYRHNTAESPPSEEIMLTVTSSART